MGQTQQTRQGAGCCLPRAPRGLCLKGPTSLAETPSCPRASPADGQGSRREGSRVPTSARPAAVALEPCSWVHTAGWAHCWEGAQSCWLAPAHHLLAGCSASSDQGEASRRGGPQIGSTQPSPPRPTAEADLDPPSARRPAGIAFVFRAAFWSARSALLAAPLAGPPAPDGSDGACGRRWTLVGTRSRLDRLLPPRKARSAPGLPTPQAPIQCLPRAGSWMAGTSGL